ncbi:hypothetical protein OPIT5_28820 [Opitutaceae bacterium TAV5]|nr:hypothetical protein OPIT5_28820 [Opitutaceae bacterium TAV5]
MIFFDPTTSPENAHEGWGLPPTDPEVVATLVELAGEAPELCNEEIRERVEREHGMKLAEWLRHYNEETPLEGYRNAGLTPRAFWQGAAGTLKAGRRTFRAY